MGTGARRLRKAEVGENVTNISGFVIGLSSNNFINDICGTCAIVVLSISTNGLGVGINVWFVILICLEKLYMGRFRSSGACFTIVACPLAAVSYHILVRYTVSPREFCSTTSLKNSHADVVVDVIIRRAMMCGGEEFDVAIGVGEGRGYIARILVYPKQKRVLEGVK